MIKYVNLISLIIILVCIAGLFQVKYHVQNLSKDYDQISKLINEEKEAIHVLKAEWTYLNQPDRLKLIISNHLKLSAIKISQIHKLDNYLPNILAEVQDKQEKLVKQLDIVNQDKLSDEFAEDVMNPKIHLVKGKKLKNKHNLTQVKY